MQINIGPRARDIAWLHERIKWAMLVVFLSIRNRLKDNPALVIYLLLLYGAFIWVMVLTGQ